MEKKPNFFIFQNGKYLHKGKTRHIAWLSSFIFKAQFYFSYRNAFIEMKMTLHQMTDTI